MSPWAQVLNGRGKTREFHGRRQIADISNWRVKERRPLKALGGGLVKRAVLGFYLCADLVAALAGLHVDDLAHGCVGVVVVGGGGEEEGRELRGRPDGE